jgi:hypothetical protein
MLASLRDKAIVRLEKLLKLDLAGLIDQARAHRAGHEEPCFSSYRP